MRKFSKELKNKTINYEKLLKYGFKKENEKYIYKENICDNQFKMIVEVNRNQMISKLIDLANEDEYILVDIEDSVGEFVGTIREEYESKIKDILNHCTTLDAFKSKQAKEIIEYVKGKYNDELEYLWENFENTAIVRNKQNNKWYALIVKLSEEKIGINSDKIVEIIDLRYQKDETEKVIDNQKVFPGYHMNKKSWITIKLDNTVATKEICDLIDNSYQLSVGNKCGLSGDNLSQKVYDYLTKIPKGKVVTYKQIAEYLGNKGLARVVGTILHKNPDGDKYPCYKVLNSKGELAEAFVFGGKEVQKQRLEKDGIKVINNKVDLKIYQWNEKG